MKNGRKPEYLEKTPENKLQQYHILTPKNSSPYQDSNPRSSIGATRLLHTFARKADTLTIIPHAAPHIPKLYSTDTLSLTCQHRNRHIVLPTLLYREAHLCWEGQGLLISHADCYKFTTQTESAPYVQAVKAALYILNGLRKEPYTQWTDTRVAGPFSS